MMPTSDIACVYIDILIFQILLYFECDDWPLDLLFETSYIIWNDLKVSKICFHSDAGEIYAKKLANFVEKRLKSEKAASVSFIIMQ